MKTSSADTAGGTVEWPPGAGARGGGEREMLLDVNMKHVEGEVQTNGTGGIAATMAPSVPFQHRKR